MKKLPLLLWSCLLLAAPLRSATPALASVSIVTSRVQFEPGDSITIREVLATSPSPGAGDVVVLRGDYMLTTRERARLSLFTTNVPQLVPTVNKEVSAGTGTFELQYTLTVAGSLRITFYDVEPPQASFGSIYFDITGAGSSGGSTPPVAPPASTNPPSGMVPIAFTTSRAQFGAGYSITVREMFASSPRLQVGDTVVVRGDYTLATSARVRLGMYVAVSGTVPATSRELPSTSGSFELQYVLPVATTLRLALNFAEPPGDLIGGLYLDGIVTPSVSVPLDAKGSLANLSTRGIVTADAPLLAGLAITDQDRFVLIRAVGPTLSAFGVTGVLRKPVISVHRSNGELVQTVASWSALPANQRTGIELVTHSVGAFPLDGGSDDAALHVRLAPGSYTITVSSGDGQPGTALFEVYSAGNYFLPASR